MGRVLLPNGGVFLLQPTDGVVQGGGWPRPGTRTRHPPNQTPPPRNKRVLLPPPPITRGSHWSRRYAPYLNAFSGGFRGGTKGSPPPFSGKFGKIVCWLPPRGNPGSAAVVVEELSVCCENDSEWIDDALLYLLQKATRLRYLDLQAVLLTDTAEKICSLVQQRKIGEYTQRRSCVPNSLLGATYVCIKIWNSHFV